jgi:DNA (cytosine-5)-methyltransferase 1
VKYLSVCSGIEAATVAWHPIGWAPVAFSEIAAFPSAVLSYRFPAVPNYGDLSKFEAWADANVDVLVGGTPCQSYSVAGLRAGLDDPRGELMLTYLAIARRYRPRWVVWENVAGVLSNDGGRAFGTLLGALVELGYGFAYRVLDAQYFGLAQRRKRVFVVGCLGDWRRAGAVLFDGPGRAGDPPARRQAGQGDTYDVAPCIGASGRGFSRIGDPRGNDALVPEIVPQAISSKWSKGSSGPAGDEVANLISEFAPVGFHNRQDPDVSGDVSHPIGAKDNGLGVLTSALRVRRLTPLECERLQGFPDDWTLIPYGRRGALAKDTPRYKAIGNSMPVPVMRWIGERIAIADAVRVA